MKFLQCFATLMVAKPNVISCPTLYPESLGKLDQNLNNGILYLYTVYNL